MLYEFKCKKCNKIVEEIVKLGTTHVKCPTCGARAEKILSVPNFVVHGYSYANLYSNQKPSSSKKTTTTQQS
jgi:putative FmdB family regulatory protein